MVILAVLVASTAVFAVLGASAEPNVTTLTVQNATEMTFGSPTGATSFVMDLINTSASGPKAGTLSQEHLVDYIAPDRLVIYSVGTASKVPTVLQQPAISCALTAYTAMVQGAQSWNAKGDTYTRTESLATYTARVPHTSGATCAPQVINARGNVDETVIIRSGYLLAARVRIVVPAQTLSSGQVAAHGVEGETLLFIEIGGVPVRTLAP